MSTVKSVNPPVVLFLLLVLAALGAIGLSQWRSAAAAAEYSAHAALTQEICDQLAAMPPGQYPASLSQLRLTFPDGGDPSLLDRFDYVSMGTNCSVRIVLGGKVLVRSFP